MSKFWVNTSECKIGGPVRFGSEGADNDNWCEPNAPRKWHGKSLNVRFPADKFDHEYGPKHKRAFRCEWGEDLPTQCFGLGPERTTLNPHQMSHFTGLGDERINQIVLSYIIQSFNS